MIQENLNLENVLEKKVRAKKTLVGSIEAKSDSYIMVISPSGIKYNIPRSHIERKVGNELMLDISFKDLQKYRIMID
ncbi:MAG TPA: hypothetical protein VJM74_05900 [Nitrososphaeraceae archaeon]|nr:hypothetical protein [Nitrososphaeraceae archaeon]